MKFFLNKASFGRKIHSKWKIRMLNFEQKVVSNDIVLFTFNRYVSLIEAVNLQQTLTEQQSLNGTSTIHIFA